MGTNNKNYSDHQRTFNNTSPSNKKQYSSQRPSPSKSINIKTPNKNFNVAGKNNYYNNNYNNNNVNNTINNNNATRLSLSGSPTSSFFAASKCFESPSPDSLPRPPSTWTTENFSTTTQSSTINRVRKALIMPTDTINNSCAMEFAAASSFIDRNDHFTQSLKLLLNVNA
jgi:hypothetical protein